MKKANQKKRVLTTCISAICEHGLIVGASDRMVTANRGEIEFELKTTSQGDNFPLKVTPLNSSKSIALMMAGDTSIQTEIALETMLAIEKSEKAGKKWSVKEAVDLYIDSYNHLKSRLAESAVLAPLGLKRQDFISIQNQL